MTCNHENHELTGWLNGQDTGHWQEGVQKAIPVIHHIWRFSATLALLWAWPAAAQNAPTANTSPDVIELFLSDLTPQAKAKLAPGGTLPPDGHELAEWFLKPLATGRGPRTPQEMDALGAKESKDTARLHALLAHRVSLLGGYPVQDLGEPIDWMRAPKDDLQWPTHLSRHYWLGPLAAAWRNTRDPRYSGAVLDVLLDWVRRTPLGASQLRWGTPRSLIEGVPAVAEGPFKNYSDGPWTSLSCEARTETWGHLLAMLWDAPQMTNIHLAPLLHSLACDHRALMVNYERWGTANQYLAIAKALVHLGWWFPDFAGASQAEQIGWTRLKRVAAAQMYPDGSMAECSPNYAIGSLGNFQALISEGERTGRVVPAELGVAVTRGARYFALIADPLGRSPRFAKGGGEVRGALQKMNALAQDDAVTFVASGGKAGKTPPLNALFPWAGHAVFRSGWDGRATWLFFEPGPRGSGHHDLAQLGVQLISNGEWLLTDPGYFSYSTAGDDGAMAAYLKTSAAHNVALIDGQGQIAVPPGAARGPNATAGEYSWQESNERVSAGGSYAYGFGDRGSIAVRHSRRVTWLPQSNVFEIRDRFEGTGRHKIELRWQADPLAEVVFKNDTVTITMPHTALRMNFTGATPLETKILRGVKDGKGTPSGGWFSAHYGMLTETTTLCTTTEADLPQEIVTKLIITTDEK
jgi:hypothetical protein